MAGSGLVHARFQSYHLVELVSSGGTADVYRAQHVDDGSLAAVKVLHEHLCSDRHRSKRFADEFELLQELDHPGIPRGRRFGEIGDRPAFAMDFVDGRTLYELRTTQTRFDWMVAFLAMTGIARYLHQNGIVHNDLKLENFILRTNGRLALVDFGNARRRRSGSGPITRFFKREKVFGTLSYIAPELVKGGTPTPASDCYALGVCLHILLAGTPPFADESRDRALQRILNEPATPLCERVPELPKSVGRVADCCLAKDPDARPADAGVLRRLVKSAFERSGDEEPTTVTRRIQRRLREQQQQS